MRQSDFEEVKNILCIRLDNMGDVLMSSPAIRALKNGYPDRKITLLASDTGAKIASFIPEIDEIITFNVPWVKLEKYNKSSEIYNLIYKLKEKKFDAAFIFTTFSQNPLPTALLCYLAHIPKVVGYCRENPYQLISYWIPDETPFYTMIHQVERDLEMVRATGAQVKDKTIRLPVSTEAIEKVKLLIQQKKGNLDKPLVVIHPGVSEAKRQYSPGTFGKIASELTKEGFQVVISGTKDEMSTINPVLKIAGKDVISAAGDVSLEEFIALISEASVLVSHNTGAVHIASAVQTPVVVLYALTNPEHVPWKVPYKICYFDVPKEMESKNVLLRYAKENYMKGLSQQIEISKVVAAVNELFRHN